MPSHESLRHIIMIITRIPNFHNVFFQIPIKLMIRHESMLFTFSLPLPR